MDEQDTFSNPFSNPFSAQHYEAAMDDQNTFSNTFSSQHYSEQASGHLQSLATTVVGATIDYFLDSAYTIGTVIYELGAYSGSIEMANRMRIAEIAAEAHGTTPGEEFVNLCDNGSGPFDDYWP
jgi:hypothetical protein